MISIVILTFKYYSIEFYKYSVIMIFSLQYVSNLISLAEYNIVKAI